MTVCLNSVIDSVAASHPVRREFESPLRLSSPRVTLSTVRPSPSSNPNLYSFPTTINETQLHPFYIAVFTPLST